MNIIRRFVFFFGVLVLVTSCVTNKQVQFLQKNDVGKKDMAIDTVLREYDLVPFDYKIQPNDALYIRFHSLTPTAFDVFSTTTGGGGGSSSTSGSNNANMIQYNADLVNEVGEVNFPVLGWVKVAGLTVFEVQRKLQQLAEQYVESPTVKVRLINYRVTVLGEVNVEGSVTLMNNRVSVMEALGLAGGLTDLADRSHVKIIHQQGDVSDVQYVDLLDEGFMTSPNYYVHQNDIIIVPPLKQRPFRKYFGPNISLVLSSISLLLIVINLTKP